MFICACSDVGKVREINQDAYFYIEDKVVPIFIVADGMGGHKAGEVASNLAISAIASYYKANRDKIENEEMFVPQFINESIAKANEKIIEESQNDEELRGMGTTITMCIIFGDEIYIGHVGDSRAYLLRDDELTQLTQDHSLVGELLRTGSITKKEAMNHPKKNVITRAVGTDSKLSVDIVNRELNLNDKIILCTDGLTNMVSEERILETVKIDENIFESCSKLVNIANEIGGIDNTTIMFIQAKQE